MKHEIKTVIENSAWCIGNGSSIILWFDSWYGSPLCDDNEAPTQVIDDSVSSIMENGSWNFSKSATTILPSLQVCINNCHIPFDIRLDKRCWNYPYNGELSLKMAYEF